MHPRDQIFGNPGTTPFPLALNTHFRNPNIAENLQEKCKQVGFFVKVKKKLEDEDVGLSLDFEYACFIAFEARTFTGEVRSEQHELTCFIY